MKPDDLKNSLNSIKPDSYMETRLFAEIKDAEKPKRKNRRIFKAAVCTVLCCTVLAAGVGIGIPKKVISDSNNNIFTSDVDYSGNYFVMSVYAAEKDKKTAIPIDDHTVTLPDCKLDRSYDLDGNFTLGGSASQSGFGFSGENIKSVKIKCEKGEFHIWDFDLLNYLEDNGMYYDIIIPYSDEYKHKSREDCLDIMFKHIKNGDYDEYIKGTQIKSDDEYEGADVVYDKDDNIIGVGLVSKENFLKIHPEEFIQEYIFENVLNKTEDIGTCFVWFPDTSELFDNPDMSFTELSHDTISIEVTFNDGSVQYASYDFSFNDNGELVIDRIAED